MQVTLVSSGNTVSHVLNQFEANFSLDWVEIKEEFTHLIVSMPDFLIKKYSIRELKAMADFLANTFSVTDLDTPKRNSKVSLAGWIAGVLLSAREVAEVSGTIAPDPEVEVLEPKEVYTISIVVADYSFSEERVNRLPPYLIDRKGNLLKKFWHRHCDAGYAEIVSEHLSNISVESGLVIKLMAAENLEVSQACICGEDPPPFIIDKTGGVYKRACDRVKLSLAVVRYAQVVSEYLSSIVI